MNDLRKTYGDNFAIAYGDWTEPHHRRFMRPTPGVGLRNLIAKKFPTFLVNERNSSKLCYACAQAGRCSVFKSKELEPVKFKKKCKKSGKVIEAKSWRCRVCNDCVRSSESNNTRTTPNQCSSSSNVCNDSAVGSESNNTCACNSSSSQRKKTFRRYINRDINGALNICYIAHMWITKNMRPSAFCLSPTLSKSNKRKRDSGESTQYVTRFTPNGSLSAMLLVQS